LSLRKTLILLLLFNCSSIDTYSYAIEPNFIDLNVDTQLIINVDYIGSDKIRITSQMFPKRANEIESYKLVYDMKFREDYQSEFNGVCIGPNWQDYGAGEFTQILSKADNYKNEIEGVINLSEGDRCNNYYFYLRFLEIKIKTDEIYLIGVATDYAEDYPDAPNVWFQNQKGEIEIMGTTNINKYSLNFELSK
jgi:hypothetical protein